MDERLSASLFINEKGLFKDLDRICGIYAITITDKVVYIGQSNDMYRRGKQHVRHMINTEGANKYRVLNEAWNETRDFDCHIIKRCDNAEEAITLESKLLSNKDIYFPLNDTGTKNDVHVLTGKKLLELLFKCETLENLKAKTR